MKVETFSVFYFCRLMAAQSRLEAVLDSRLEVGGWSGKEKKQVPAGILMGVQTVKRRLKLTVS